MTQVVNGVTGETEGSFTDFLEEQAREHGEEVDDGDLNFLEDSDYDTDEVEEGEPEEVEEEPPRRRAGTDEVMARLRSDDPEAAEVLLAMQRKMSQNSNEFNSLKSELLDLREKLIERLETEGDQTGDTESSAPEDDLPETVTPEHIALFEKMAKRLGFVKREELQQEKAAETSESYVDKALREGFEQYGEAFGVENSDGSITVNSEVAERLDARLKALQDPSVGITPLDLFRLEFPNLAPREADKEEEVEAPSRRNRAKHPAKRRPQRSNVVRRSAGGTSRRVKIRTGKSDDSSDDVLDRAWAASKWELTS